MPTAICAEAGDGMHASASGTQRARRSVRMRLSLGIAKSSLDRVRSSLKFQFFAALQKPSWASSLLFLTPECAECFALISPRFQRCLRLFEDYKVGGGDGYFKVRESSV